MVKEKCPRCDGHGEDFECPYWESAGYFFKDGREVPKWCFYCKHGNSYGPHGCPVCWDIHKGIIEEVEK